MENMEEDIKLKHLLFLTYCNHPSINKNINVYTDFFKTSLYYRPAAQGARTWLVFVLRREDSFAFLQHFSFPPIWHLLVLPLAFEVPSVFKFFENSKTHSIVFKKFKNVLQY